MFLFVFADFDVKTSGVSSSTDSSTCHDIPTVAAAKLPLAASETAVVDLLTAATNCNVIPGSQDLEHLGTSGSSTEIIDSWTWGNTPGELFNMDSLL